MSYIQKLRILIAPLDWGLGHTTRCIPIIKFLIECKCTVIIASEGHCYNLLQTEFPTLQFLNLRGYRVRYTGNKRFLPIKMLCQLPKVLSIIVKEHKWLRKTITEHNIDAVISDNRFGLWSEQVPSVFITHQLQIKGPNKWVEWILRRVNYQHINKYQVCWVPDYKHLPNLAGKLSHPRKLPLIPVEYLGPVSRFTVEKNPAFVYDVMFLISGPEPQRTILEQLVTRQLTHYTDRALIVRGLPGERDVSKGFNQVTIVNHLPAAEMATAIQASKFVVSRAGYTSIMDMTKLGKKCILIPTPGQTEQEYLAHHLQSQRICLAADQQHFNLDNSLKAAADFNYLLPTYNMDSYKEVVGAWLQKLTPDKEHQASTNTALQQV